MADLKHAAPTTVSGACSLLAEYGDRAVVLSGGQSMLPVLRQRLASYDVLVDINELEGQKYVAVEDGQLRVGCLVRHADAASSSTVRRALPTLADVAGDIGDVQVRNRGTICGAVAHADPAGDPPVLVDLLDAGVVAASADGERIIDGDSFYYGFYETALEKEELVREIRFPVPGEDAGAGYEKWEPTEGAYPVATVGAYLELEEGAVAEARLATGAIEGGPTRMPEAADVLVDRIPEEDVLTEAAETLGENATPRDDFEGSAEFKTELTKTLAKDALETASDRAGA